MCRFKEGKAFKGYMTLEASLVMPMVICVLVLIIYFSFYLYGRCVLSQDVYILAFRASQVKTEQYRDDPVSYVNEKAAEKSGKKYFGSAFPIIEAKQEGKDIRVHGKCSAKHSVMSGYFLMPKGSFEYEAAGRAKRRDYALHIRRAIRFKDLGKEIINRGDF